MGEGAQRSRGVAPGIGEVVHRAVVADETQRGVEAPQVETGEDPARCKFGVGRVDQLKTLVEDETVDLARLHATTHALGALQDDDVATSSREHLGCPKSGHASADDDDIDVAHERPTRS